MAVHFKFRSAVEYDSINIEGHFISIASLKDKIVEHKNLGRATDFDLLITNAQTGDEYSDDSFLVPKNTSLIIKRVPASRPKPILRVDDEPKAQAPDLASADQSRGSDISAQPPAFSNPGADSMDDFGVDLYAVPEPMPSSRIDSDENSRIAAMVNKTASDWQRQTQEAFAGGRGGYGRGGYGRGAARGTGRGFGRATPPQGYVCHRCGQPGHFIQHCPTNGDPTYDMRRVKLPVGIPKTRLKADQEGSYILPDGSVAVMQPDETVFAREADALLAIRPTMAEPPPELRCPLCSAIFRDAVMIPCCHYSFCDKCIRQELIAKGKCPQCGSSKFKNDDLLPNIALRQAIDRFLEAQVTTSSASDGFLKQQQQTPDVESAPRGKVLAPAASRLQIELRKPSSAAVVAPQAVSKDVVPAHSVGESAKEKEKEKEADEGEASAAMAVANAVTVAAVTAGEDSGDAIEGPPSKGEVAEAVGKEEGGVSGREEDEKPALITDEGEAGMMSKSVEPSSFKETEGVAVESEVSKGKKKKKRARPPTAGDGAADYMSGGKLRKMQSDRFCFICGSPDHLVRDCMENSGPQYNPHPGMFGPGVPMPPNGMPPYGGGDMYWHGPPMPQHGRPFPGGYGENMYGPGPGPLPFEGAPMMPGPPYGAPQYMPHMYHGGPMHGGFMGGGGPAMVGPMDRPLSREEFMELQERERRRRVMQDHSEREWSQERLYSREGNMRPQTPESERRRRESGDRRVAMEDHQNLSRKRELDRDSVRNYSDETDYLKNKSGRPERKHVSERLVVENHLRRRPSLSDDDVVSFDDLKGRHLPHPRARDGKTVSFETKRESARQYQGEEYSSEREAHDGLYGVTHEKREREGARTNRGKRMDDSKIVHVNVGVSRHRSSKRTVSEDSKRLTPNEEHTPKHARSSSKSQRHDRKHLTGYELDVEDEGRYEDVEKPKRKRHQSGSKSNGESEPVEYDSEESRKKRKKHRKHQEDNSVDRVRDGRGEDIDLPAKHRKYKVKTLSHAPASSIEVARWQLVESELDESRSSHTHRSKNKNQCSYNGKLK